MLVANIVRLDRYQASNASRGVGHVTNSARNQMDVAVKYCLPGCRAVILARVTTPNGALGLGRKWR